MKKGTTVESGYDAAGRWHLKIKKAKGKFTLDEIIVEALEDMRDKLYKADNPKAYSVSDCCKTLNTILEVREKRKIR